MFALELRGTVLRPAMAAAMAMVYVFNLLWYVFIEVVLLGIVLCTRNGFMADQERVRQHSTPERRMLLVYEGRGRVSRLPRTKSQISASRSSLATRVAAFFDNVGVSLPLRNSGGPPPARR